MTRLLCLALLLAAAPLPAVRAQTGLDIVNMATEAAGGHGWKRPQTLYFEGRMTLYPEGDPAKKTLVDRYRMWRRFPAVSEAAHRANGKVRFDARSSNEVVFQIAFDGEKTYNEAGLVEDAVATTQWSAAFGFGIIRFADSPGFSVRRLADDQVEGYPCYFVEITDAAGGSTIFGIDRDSYAVRQVGFATPRGWHERIYSAFAWHENPRFRQPQRVRLYYDGRLTNDIFWHTFKINGPVDDQIFVIDPANPID
ncbi:MAG: hypothetical protein AAGA23_00555 [Pseudomonadota bacterium]